MSTETKEATPLDVLREHFKTRREVAEYVARAVYLELGMEVRVVQPSEILRWEDGQGPGAFWSAMLAKAAERLERSPE